MGQNLGRKVCEGVRRGKTMLKRNAVISRGIKRCACIPIHFPVSGVRRGRKANRQHAITVPAA